MFDDRSGADHAVVSDGDTVPDRCIATDKDPITECDVTEQDSAWSDKTVVSDLGVVANLASAPCNDVVADVRPRLDNNTIE
jgi:hypothetical protein